MNKELLVSLAEAMLNEGIDEDSIISVLSNLVEEQEEVLPVSESCFDSIVSLTEAIIQSVTEDKVDDYYQGKLDRTKSELATTKAQKRHLNKTVDKKANINYKRAKAKADNAYYDCMMAPSDTIRDWKDQDYDVAYDNLQDAKKKFSSKGTELYHKIIDLKNKRDSLNKYMTDRSNTKENGRTPSIPLKKKRSFFEKVR